MISQEFQLEITVLVLEAVEDLQVAARQGDLAAVRGITSDTLACVSDMAPERVHGVHNTLRRAVEPWLNPRLV